MALYRITPEASSISCAAGGATLRSDGLWELENGEVVEALLNAGLSVEVAVAEPALAKKSKPAAVVEPVIEPKAE